MVFALTFFFCRLVVGPFITFGTIFCPTSSIVVKVRRQVSAFETCQHQLHSPTGKGSSAHGGAAVAVPTCQHARCTLLMGVVRAGGRRGHSDCQLLVELQDCQGAQAHCCCARGLIIGVSRRTTSAGYAAEPSTVDLLTEVVAASASCGALRLDRQP